MFITISLPPLVSAAIVGGVVALWIGVILLGLMLMWTTRASINAQIHDEIARTNPTIGRGAIIRLVDDRVKSELDRRMDEPLSMRPAREAAEEDRPFRLFPGPDDVLFDRG